MDLSKYLSGGEPPVTEEQPRMSKEEYAALKKQEREEVWAEIDAKAQDVFKDGDTQLFQTLYYVADRKYGGRLPIPVNCIMDEWPNVALPDDFEKILSTCRSRSIFCSIIVQNMSQIKALFKDSWESLVGNCVRPEVASAL